ncbi:glycerol-3-phosphate dehydrogenase/oxidase [Burkholderia multivorans]|uniref:glycerol-3-phosphate dehydrogenase/oxidase n=1 Tax=Burkholderia multivorans TaxID=87883 RepID=UPI0019D277AC|nr:glycerol-3-phosphate dehydrogenase/oxidase [Burkholderia multivorans]MBN6738833.1 glycerol-3-phosphate dehydrogenase/oxidase [Burkholderia multivorans]MBN7130106.1 glycerol-3-phosphate dehydrogenase/oxidase [Burkholderia multivorans]MBN8173463.1 glycerol-3-phosphate dehydrogenase/oxidase [Burkholderia multivorans]QSL29413.1 glycerol-3-phosphate dehydrogenase/oxidase [Burkholderia multivorans]
MTDLNPAPRAQLLREIDQTPVWDVVVIGGGATGLGTAVDAAARGYRTLLVEARDFAKGTSSKATKLVHGGVRYLAQGNISLVREALRERGLLARNAPHVVGKLGFVVPAYRRRDKPFYGAGLKIYDWLAGSLNLSRSHGLSAAETHALLPTLAGELQGRPLRGGTLYYDGQFDDARLAISLMRTVFDLGGIALNNAAVRAIKVDSATRQHVLAIDDVETGNRVDVRARCVINATGVWVDAIRAMVEPTVTPIVAPSQGVHLTLPARFLQSRHAILVPRTDDGRVLFVVPWHGHTIVGTTDTPRTDMPIDPHASERDIDFILATATRYLSITPTRADVLSVWAGLRPLVKGDAQAATASLSREHTLEVHPGGMITVTGGKWTTYRRMAEEVVDLAIANGLLPAAPCRTGNLPLHGARPASDADEGVSAAGATAGCYGSDGALIARMPGADRVLVKASGLTEAQVRFAARAELARSVEDVLARRNRALFLDAAAARAVAPEVARILAEELGCDAGWASRETAAFTEFAGDWLLR